MIAPLMDWEDANHAISAISAGIGMLLDVYRALKGEGGDEEEDEKRPEPQVGTVDAEGKVTAVPLSQFLGDHEVRLRALEERAKSSISVESVDPDEFAKKLAEKIDEATGAKPRKRSRKG